MLCSLASDRGSRASTSGRASKAGGALERIGNLSPTKRRSTSDPKADGRNSVMGGRSPGGRSPGGRRSLERTKRMNITVFETKYSIVPEKVLRVRLRVRVRVRARVRGRMSRLRASRSGLGLGPGLGLG